MILLIFKNLSAKRNSELIISTTTVLILMSTQFGLLNSGFICRSDPCLNGICIDYLETPLEYSCFCINGFTGYSCQINWDECRSSPCLNGGECLDGIASFNCTCPANFTGSICQFDLSTTCGSHLQCQNNGTCLYNNAFANSSANSQDAGVGNCMCLPGFAGYHCEMEAVNCSSPMNSCLNGECVFDNLTLIEHCSCEAGFSGKFCQIDIDDCASRPCHHDGVCLDKINGFDCACPFGYTGRICENQLKVCEENPCVHGFCLVEEDIKKTCYCVPDYHGELCQFQYNECEPEPQCHNGGTCIDGVGGFNCSCPPEFYGPICQCSSTSANISQECQEILDNMTTSTTTTEMMFTSWLPSPSPTTTMSMVIVFPSEDWMTTTLLPISPSSTLVPQSSEYSYEIMTTIQEFDSSTTYFVMSKTPMIEYSTSITSTSLLLLPESTADFYDSSESLSLTTAIITRPGEFDSASLSDVLLTKTEGMEPSFSPVTTPVTISISESLEEESKAFSPTMTSFSTFIPEPTIIIVEPYPSSDLLVSSDTFEPFTTTMLDQLPNETSTVLFTLTSTIEFTSTAEESRTTHQYESTPITFVIPIIETDTLPSMPEEETSTILFTPSMTSMIDETTQTAVSRTTYILTSIIQEEGESSKGISMSPSEMTYTTSTLSTMSTLIQPPQSQSVTLYDSETIYWDSTLSYVGPIQTVTEEWAMSSTVLIGETLGVESGSSIFGEISQDVPAPVQTTISYSTSFLSHYHTVSTLSEISVTQTTEDETGLISPTKSLDSSQLPSPITTSVIFYPTSEEPLSSTTGQIVDTNFTTTTSISPITDPCENYCHNNATCSMDSEKRPICQCPFKFSGEQCTAPKEKILVPSFQGNSYLAYNLSSSTEALESEPNTMIDISITLATLVRNGLVFYTGVHNGLTYVLVFIQNGHVSLHFSCGEQSMSFVETRTRVDTGFNFTLNFKMETVLSDFNEVHCSGRLMVNGSYTMGGDQIVGKSSLQFQRQFELLLLGGIEPKMKDIQERHDGMIRDVSGLRGCVYQLMLNKVEQDMYDLAIDGFNIGECSNFVCTTNPCFGSSTCVPSHKFPLWECICAERFEGIRCQIPICSHNPCLNGGSCIVKSTIANNTSSANDLATINSTETTACNCKVGFTGATCQTLTNVTQPSFHPLPNYSSYISYVPLTNMKDWFQLKFHFLTKNMTQFGLLLFIGGKNPYYYHYGATTAAPEKEEPRLGLQIESPEIIDESSATMNEIALDHEDGEEKVEGSEEEEDQSLDFFAISFLQGYLAVTWHLGSGVQRIVSPYRIDTRLSIHTLYTGRSGTTSWLKVDGMTNVSGTSSGKYKRLDTGTSQLFIGGYDTFRMEGLPYDLSLHEGFEGCVFDLGFRVKNMLFLPKVSSGRNVGNCFVDYYNTPRKKR